MSKKQSNPGPSFPKPSPPPAPPTPENMSMGFGYKLNRDAGIWYLTKRNFIK